MTPSDLGVPHGYFRHISSYMEAIKDMKGTSRDMETTIMSGEIEEHDVAPLNSPLDKASINVSTFLAHRRTVLMINVDVGTFRQVYFPRRVHFPLDISADFPAFFPGRPGNSGDINFTTVAAETTRRHFQGAMNGASLSAVPIRSISSLALATRCSATFSYRLN